MGEVGPIPLDPGQWIWTPDNRKNQYSLFVKDLDVAFGTSAVRIWITASYHYELFVNGRFVNRGPVHGDPKWCSYDNLTFIPNAADRVLHVSILVHHCSETYLHCLTPAPPGLRAVFDCGVGPVGTDRSWLCRTLEMWKNEVPPRGWALGYCEDYDARLEPAGWGDMVFGVEQGFTNAVLVERAESLWTGYHERIPPYLRRERVEPVLRTAWRADGEADGATSPSVFDLSKLHDEERLSATDGDDANAFTHDLGKEYIGFYELDIEAPAGTVVEISGAELLQDDDSGRPWIFRKDTNYAVRYTCGDGRRIFRSFSWNGFRFIHVVIRGDSSKTRVNGVWCLERRAPLTYTGTFTTEDDELRDVFNLCRRTLEVGVFEHTVDCPTREQAPAWADSAGIAESIYRGFGDPSYLIWYLEAFIQAPLNEHGLFCGRYPGTRGYWLDFCLIPLLVQRFYRDHCGAYYKPRATLEKGLALKRWYDGNRNNRGLVSFDFQDYYRRGFRNFIDHPGLGMHNAGHVGIDREGTSCGLNCFFYGFVRELAGIATAAGSDSDAQALADQAAALRSALRDTFYDGMVYHDAERLSWDDESGRLSAGTSWQTNGLAVYMEIANAEEAPVIMRKMLDGYDSLCRCTPYSHVYFLPALRIAGMEQEATELIKREWRTMLEGGATTTWEGFLGDERDSLCHPFSTAPFLFLLSAPA